MINLHIIQVRYVKDESVNLYWKLLNVLKVFQILFDVMSYYDQEISYTRER